MEVILDVFLLVYLNSFKQGIPKSKGSEVCFKKIIIIILKNNM